jgi:hypothetical protein
MGSAGGGGIIDDGTGSGSAIFFTTVVYLRISCDNVDFISRLLCVS